MADARNIRLIGHTDLGGQGDGMHVGFKDGYAFVGHMGETGTSIVDVRDPRDPHLVGRIPIGGDTHGHKVQIQGDVLITNRELIPRRTGPHGAGLMVYDISTPMAPREIAFWPCGGLGVHRMTWWDGPLAYVTAGDDEIDGQFLVVLDLSEPSRPTELGRWWMPGQRLGEPHAWDDNWRVKLHHAIVRDGLAFCSWWDEGLVVLDVHEPSAITMVGHLNLGHDAQRSTHTFCPLPGRDIAVTTEERITPGCEGVAPNARLVDIADPANPRVLATLPIPAGDYCTSGGRFGPHNISEPQPGALVDGDIVYLTYFNAGLRVFDVANPTDPREIGHYVPDAPSGQQTTQLNDVTVTPDGLIYVTDRLAGGLYILERTN